MSKIKEPDFVVRLFFVILKLPFSLEGLFMTRLEKVRNSMKEQEIDLLFIVHTIYVI